MSVYPHSRLFVGPSRTLVISGPHLQVLDSTTGIVLSSTANHHPDAVGNSGPVRCVGVDGTMKYLACAGDDKMLRVWEVEGLVLLNERELPKKPTGIRFTRDGQAVLVSDKFGDIFRYPLHPSPSPPSIEGRDPAAAALASHSNPSGGQLVLGHTSLLTAFILTEDERYIVTADRDEHIRVSWYPEGYVVERFCLGHEKFVSAIHIPRFDHGMLISGGGDPVLKMWDWMEGMVKREVGIWESVAEYVAVRPGKRRKRRRGGESDEDGDEEEDGERKGKGKRKGNRRGTGKATKKAEGGPNEGDDEGVEGPSDAKPEATVSGSHLAAAFEHFNETAKVEHAKSTEKGEATLVVYKIDSLDTGRGRYIIFSAVGVTALFTCPSSVTGQDSLSTEEIRTFDFGKPVLDFYVREDGMVWVSLDAEWSGVAKEMGKGEGESNCVRVVRLCNGELMESTDSAPTLLLALNTSCLIPASLADLKTLDLYGALEAMPKNTEVEHNAMDRDGASGRGKESGKGVSKKELGRLKSKKALLDKVLRGGGVEEKDKEKRELEVGGEVLDGRDIKRARGKSGDWGGGGVDVHMMDS